MFDWLVETVDNATKPAREAAGRLYDGMTEAVDDAREATGELVDRAQEQLSETADAIQERAEDAAEWAQEKGEELAQAVEERIDELRDQAQAAAEWAQDKAEETAEWAQEKAEQAADAGRRAVDGIDNFARNQSRDRIRHVADASSRLGGKYNTAKEKASDTVRNVREYFGDAPIEEPEQRCEDCTPDGSLVVYDQRNPNGCTHISGGSFRENLATAQSRAYVSDSNCCKNKRGGSPPQTIYYTNGINTGCRAHTKTLKRISDITCAKVVGIFNDTEGTFQDISHTGSARQALRDERAGARPNDYQSFTPAVKTIQRTMSSELMSGNDFTIFAHSEGGANTSLATHRASEGLRLAGFGELVEKTKIISMGSAAPEWADGPDYTHLIHTYDSTPNLMGLGDSNRGAGRGARVHRFDGDRANGFNSEPAKRPWGPYSYETAHNMDDSYLEYYNQQTGGCGHAE